MSAYYKRPRMSGGAPDASTEWSFTPVGGPGSLGEPLQAARVALSSFPRPERTNDIYYLASTSNGNVSDTVALPTLSFTDLRNSTLLADTLGYQVSVPRFTINGARVPVYAPSIRVGQADPNKTDYNVTLTFEWTGIPQPTALLNFEVTAGVNDLFQVASRDARGYTIGAGAPATILPGVYADIAAFAAAVQVAVRASGDPSWAAATVTTTLNNCLVFGGGTAGTQLVLNFAESGASPVPDPQRSATAALIGAVADSEIVIPVAGTAVLPNAVVAPATAATTSPLFTSTQWVMWSPQELDVAAPAPPIENKEVTKYYYGRNIPWFTTLVNNALQAAMDDLASQFATWWTTTLALPAQQLPRILTQAPQFVWQGPGAGANSGCFTAFFDTYGFGGPARASAGNTGPGFDESFTLYTNSPFSVLMKNFQMTNWGTFPPYAGATADAQYEWIVGPFGPGTNLYQPTAAQAAVVGIPATTSYWQIVQEAPSTNGLWMPFDAIVVQSFTLPIMPQYVTPAQAYGPTSQGSGSVAATNNNFAPQLRDVVLTLGVSAYEVTGTITFIEQGETKWTDMRPGSSITEMGLTFSWRNRLTGATVDLNLDPGGSASAEIHVRRIPTTSLA